MPVREDGCCRLCLGVLAFLALCWPSVADAAGFYLMPRGVLAGSVGAANVASISDPTAMWTNPAGLARSGQQLSMDFLMPVQSVDYTRMDAAGDFEPTVSSTSAPLPVPGFAYSDTLGSDLTWGAALFVPTASLHSWPRCVVDPESDGVNRGPGPCPLGQRGAPTRHTLLSIAGSGFAFFSGGLAWRPNHWLSLGAVATAVAGRFVVDVVMSTCDGGVLCASGDYERYDAEAHIEVPYFIRPSGALGMQIDLEGFRAGLALVAPFQLAGEASLEVQLPPGVGAFEGAELTNTTADLEAGFPMIIRAGLGYDFSDRLSLETQFTWEQWSVQDAMRVYPQDISIESPVLGEYEMGPIEMERGMQDSFAYGVGLSYQATAALQLRGGTMYERSALPDEYMTILTPDSDKLMVGAGFSYGLGPMLGMFDEVLVDVTAGHLFMRNISVRDTELYQPAALRPPPPECDEWQSGCATPLGNGDYKVEASYVGVGARMFLGE